MALINTIFTTYLWFVGAFVVLIIGLLIVMAGIFVLGQMVILWSKLCLLLKRTYAKVLLKAGTRSAPSVNHGV